MRALLRPLALCLTLGLATPVATQTPEQDKDFLTGLLEGALSSAGREVRIDGFAGALSSRATIEQLSIGDAEGTWLTAEGIVLDWNRSALFSGRLEINQLSAARIDIPRPPVPDPGLPPPEAGEFRVPQIPVAVSIAALFADEVTLGRPVLGQEARVVLSGSAEVDGARGSIVIETERLDRPGRIRLAGSYDPDTTVLALDLAAREAPDGLFASMLDLPGRPSVDLTLKGEAPFATFDAALRLATDGVERVTGTIRGLPGATGGQAVRVYIAGDIATLLPPSQRAFFPGRSRLDATLSRDEAGRMALENMELETRFARLKGRVALDANGWPVLASVAGEIADTTGAPVTLPGSDWRLGTASITLDFDAAQDNGWTGTADIAGLDGPALTARTVSLAGTGTLDAQRNGQPGAIAGRFDFGAAGLVPADPALAAATGPDARGQVEVAWTKGMAVDLPAIALRLGDAVLKGAARFERPAEGIVGTLDIDLDAADIARFSALAGRDLGGAARVGIAGTATLLTGAFDLRIDGTTQGLRLSDPRLDALTQGAARLELDAARDTTGLTLRRFRVTSSEADIDASGILSSVGGRLEYAARIADIAHLFPGQDAAGRADVAGDVRLIADNVVEHIRAEGLLSSADGPVRLPLGAYSPNLAEARFGADYALETGALTLRAAVEKFTHPMGTAEALVLAVDGTVRQGAGGGIATAQARIAAGVQGISGTSPAIAAVLGKSPGLTATVDWHSGAPLAVEDIVLKTAVGQATGRAELAEGADALAFDADLSLPDLGRLSGLIGADMGGSLDANVMGSVALPSGDATVALTGSAAHARIGPALLAQWLGARTDIDARLRTEAGRLVIDEATVTGGGGARLRATGDLTRELRLSARIADGTTLASPLEGELTAEATLRPAATGWQLEARVQGPGGSRADVAGTIPGDGRIEMRATGTAPLGLVNRSIAPRRATGDVTFDLALSGLPELRNLTGTLSTRDAAISDSGLQAALQDLVLDMSLSGGRAQVSATGRVAAGGGIAVNGEIALDAPFEARLETVLTDVQIRRRGLLQSSIDGTATLEGPLAGGARIGGRFELGATEVHVAATGYTTLGEIPDITHVDASGAVRETITRADLDPKPVRAGATGPDWGLDIRIRAPSRVFVRGRGIDAELGGEVWLGGTTREVRPQGQFELIRGRIEILGQRFDLTEGTAQIVGNFDPELRLVAETEKNGTSITVAVEGSASAPEVTFRSTPELPQDEVLALLLFGRDLSTISAFQALELASAVATLAGKGGDGIVAKIRTRFKLDDLDITEGADGQTEVRIGKYIGDRVYSNVTVDVQGKTRIDLNLDLSKNVKARGSASSDGETGLGVYFEKDY